MFLNKKKLDFYEDLYGANMNHHQTALWNDFMAATLKNEEEPLDCEFHLPFKRVWENAVNIELYPLKNNGFCLHKISSRKWGRGDGGEALQWIQELSDKHQMIICGSVLPFDKDEDNPLADKKALSQWYKKRGFITIDNDFQEKIAYFPSYKMQ